MGPDGPKNENISIPLKSEPVFHGHGPFPPVAGALNLFDPQGWMRDVFHQQDQLLIKSLLNVGRQFLVRFLESPRESIRLHDLSHCNPFSAVSNGSDSSSFSMSSSASASMFCHSWVQYQP